MYIYADETGNTGKDVFAKPELYREGAILSVDDIDPIISPTLERFKRELGLARIHAHEIPRDKVRQIGGAMLDALDGGTTWCFHLTEIHKPYLVTAKFVDTVFDSGENRGARWLWYNIGFFRHTLCCLIDEMLTPDNRRAFWEAYLADDHEGVRTAVRNARTYLNRFTSDRRLTAVVLDAFDFALQHPEEITLMASRRKDSYKGHTPNMVAFTILMQAAHEFAEAHTSLPRAFYHDRQTEFARSMCECMEIFARCSMRQGEITRPWQPGDLKIKDYDLGKFSMPSSKDFGPLQAVDVLLWTMQREGEPGFEALRQRVRERAETFYISRGMSELIRLAGLKMLAQRSFTDEELLRGKELLDSMEADFRRNLRDFSRGPLSGSGVANYLGSPHDGPAQSG
jgi:hypothetical protein